MVWLAPSRASRGSDPDGSRRSPLAGAGRAGPDPGSGETHRGASAGSCGRASPASSPHPSPSSASSGSSSSAKLGGSSSAETAVSGRKLPCAGQFRGGVEEDAFPVIHVADGMVELAEPGDAGIEAPPVPGSNERQMGPEPVFPQAGSQQYGHVLTVAHTGTEGEVGIAGFQSSQAELKTDVTDIVRDKRINFRDSFFGTVPVCNK